MRATFVIFRFDPAIDKRPRYQEYAIDVESTDKILDCLNRIRWELDPTLVYRASCSHGICGSDAMVINGHVGLACQKLVRDYKTANNFVIEPLPLFTVIKDLIVDMNPFFEKHRYVRPYLTSDEETPEKERVQSAAEQKVIEPALRCILCACCTSSCPISRANPNYLGPAALLRAFWGCKTMWWCTDVCPKGIPVTKCIGQIKRAIKLQEKHA